MRVGPRNPYVAGNPVGDSAAFVGRDDVLRTVLRVLRHDEQNAIVLYGQRRIGKTSILQHLRARLPKEGPYCPVYFDLQDKAALSLDRVLQDLACAIAHALGQPAPDLGANPAAAFRDQWLPGVLDGLPEGSSVVLLLDEFDVLADAAAEQAAKAFFPYLRELLASDPARLKFDFVIGRNIDDLDNIALSVFKGTPARRISLLCQEDCARLARLSEANGSLLWSDEAIARVWELTSGHPFMTQSLCSHVWERAFDRAPATTPTVTAAEVDAAVPEALDASRNTMEWLWAGLPPAERVVAATLAEAGSTALAPEALERLLHDAGVRVVIRELQSAPALLQEWDLIEPTDGGFRFRVELLRRWIAENKPLSRVQEELDYIEPVAENLYQAALGLYQAGQLEGSVDVLRRAVALNPNHVRANQLLADNLLAQGSTAEAVELLERLFQYQPAAARPRLVQALLSMAQRAAAPDVALGHYERVLALDPVQPEAVAGRARIWSQRGDAARQAGDLDAAIQAYEMAGSAEGVRQAREEQRRQALQADLRMLDTAEQGGAYAQALDLARTLAQRYPADRDWAADIERLERRSELKELYQRALGALHSGDRQMAQGLLVQVVSIQADYEQATRYLHLAVSGVDPGGPADEVEPGEEAVPPAAGEGGAKEQPRAALGRAFARRINLDERSRPRDRATDSERQGKPVPAPLFAPEEPLMQEETLNTGKLLWWLVAQPARLKAHRQARGEADERQAGAWLGSTLVWLPVLLLFLRIAIVFEANHSAYVTALPQRMVVASFPAWLLLGALGSRPGTGRAARWLGWAAGIAVCAALVLASGTAAHELRNAVGAAAAVHEVWAIGGVLLALGGALGVALVVARRVVPAIAAGALLGIMGGNLSYWVGMGWSDQPWYFLAAGLLGLGLAALLAWRLRHSLETGQRSLLVYAPLLLAAAGYVLPFIQ